LALHRFLARRLADYDYDRHFGGVFYLFLRGMDPQLGYDSGVFRERPSRSFIEALDRYLAEGTR
jgi:exodeoxyribonuclease V beta subunit